MSIKHSAYDDDLGNIVLSAIRYGLPRKTAIICDHIAFTQKHWADITDYWRGLILRDCKDALRKFDAGIDLGGIDDLCVEDVRQFVSWMTAQGTEEAR